MIHSISCKNFYSFGELTSLSFVVGNNAKKNDGYFIAPSGTRLSKIEAVIGSNASGKTNLLKVLPFIKWLITDSFNMSPLEPLPVRQFLFEGYKDRPVDFSVVFEIASNIYTYNFTIDQTKILSEELKFNSFVKENRSIKRLFIRTWNDLTQKYDFDGENFELPKEIENILRFNASVISVATRLNHSLSQSIFQYWQQVETNVVEAGWIGDQILLTGASHLLKALDFFSENEILRKEAEKLLSRFDLGFDRFEFKKEKRDNGFSLEVKVAHSFGGQIEFLPMQYESSGTQRLFMLLKHILQALAYGSIAVIDEFDVNLHPDMVLALLELFVQPETNTKNAQLLFSTHSHLVLSKLDKQQIVLVEKSDKGMSESWRLDEMNGVRPDENYFTKYMAGAYGAVPKL